MHNYTQTIVQYVRTVRTQCTIYGVQIQKYIELKGLKMIRRKFIRNV